MSESWLHIGLGASCLMTGITLGFLLRGCGSSEIPNNPEPIVQHDTISIHDTLRIAQHTKPREVVRYDTLYLPVVAENATTTTDADFALVPITQSEYRDTFATDSTRAEVAVLFSGYNARIDSVGINYQSTIQPRVERKKNGWGQFVGIGVGAGYGFSFGSPIAAAPEIGIHIVYGFGYHW